MGNRGPKTIRKVLLLVFLLGVPGVAQNGSAPVSMSGMQQPFSQITSGDDNIGPGDPVWQEKQLRTLNAARQKELVADTNKLLKLAKELDAEVGSANPDSLTADQLRRIAEIEKLAHSVKEKMSTSVRGMPMYPLDASPRMR
jgi:hypothetical protein